MPEISVTSQSCAQLGTGVDYDPDAGPGVNVSTPTSTGAKHGSYVLTSPATTESDVEKTHHIQLPSTPTTHGARDGIPRPWKATWFQFGPLSGIFAILLALASLIMAAAVLITSDGKAVDAWGDAEPATLLAISTAIANVSIRFACIQGVVNTWWIRALKGSPLAKLHHDWRSGTTFRGAVTAGRHIGLLGLAMIFSTVSVISGPLLQRSSSVKLAQLDNQPVDLAISMAPEIPSGYNGVWATSQETGFTTHPFLAFNDTIPSGNGGTASNNIWSSSLAENLGIGTLYYSDAPVPGVVAGCPGNCRATIRAPALSRKQCMTRRLDVNYREVLVSLDPNPSVAAPLDQLMFFIGASLIVDDASGLEQINIVTGFSDTEDCEGTLQYTACVLEAAIGEYDITIENNTVLLDSVAPPRILSIANNTKVYSRIDPRLGYHQSTLAMVVSYFLEKWGTFVATYKAGNTSYLGTYGEVSYLQYQLPSSGACSPYEDAFEDMLMSLNKIMFISGAIAAQKSRSYLESTLDKGLSAEVHHHVTGRDIGDHPVYRSDYWWLLAAAVVEIACIAIIAPTYWGWWKIGRPVSFSPLEIAKAFDAPLLGQFDSNSTGRDLSKAVWEKDVRYGASRDERGMDKLRFAPTGIVVSPTQGAQYP